MPTDPAVPIEGPGPDEAIAAVPSRRRRRRLALRRPVGDAVRTLQLLLVGSILAPLLVLLAGGYLSYQETFERARTELAETAAIAEENIIKVLDTHALVAARVADLLAGLSDEEIRAREKELHDRIRLQIADLPQVETAWAVDRTGHLLVGGRNFPARNLDLSDRDYFKSLREAGPEVYISGLQSRFDNKPFFTVARRRVSDAGEFEGVLVVAVSPDFFHSFYSKLLPDDRDYAAGLFRADGATLARYPEIVWRDSGPAPPAALMRAAAQSPQSGVFLEPSAFDGIVKMIAYKRLERYPIYVTIGRTRDSIRREWAGIMLTHFYFGVPATAALFLLCLLALRRTRREAAAIAEARQAMTEREAAEAQLRQAQKMEAIGQLTSGIAHDFNNLLTAISGNVELLQRGVGDGNPELQRLAGAAMRGVDRAGTLTQRLLAFSRRQPLDPKPLDPNRLIAAMSDLLRRTLGEGIEAEAVLAAGLWTVFIDANQLEHSLLNLAINARDAMSGRGKLTIETANAFLDESYAGTHEELAPGQYVMISVTDTGSGMTPDVRDRAFEPFFTTKESGQGTGLGLSQVYGFIKQSGGHCAIYSEPGQGTTVKLYLPRYLGAVEPAAPPAATTAGGGHGETILIVEDDADVRGFAADLLRDLGYQVVAAATGPEGLDLLDRHPDVRLLFTDIGLPGGMSGRQVAEEAGRRRPGLKVLYTTGYARNAIVHQGRVDAGVELIVKPFTGAALASRVRRMLDNSQ
ncbi:MAG: response regulator [Alphaproteobacteria bacterium]|nr:response regulator [Alphaproteobacteria bacterium]